jgi:hypothetical protein
LLASSVVIFVIVSFLIFNVFILSFTDMLVFIANTLACVTFNLDILSKLLATKDIKVVNLPMVLIGTLNMFIWFLYTGMKGIASMTIANFAGVSCGMALIFAYLFASGKIREHNPLTLYAKGVSFIFYELPTGVFKIGPKEAAKYDEVPQKGAK